MNNSTSRGASEEPWLTLAEIADELRVNPATVRLWVSKGQLNATRAGMRKWVVRRSDLDRMLASVNPAAEKVPEPAAQESTVPRRRATDRPAVQERQPARFLPPIGTRESAKKLMELANESVRTAFEACESAPPSAGYPDRLRALADGFEHLASTLIHSARTAGGVWEGRDDWKPEDFPHEIRPGGNRPRRDGLWDRFDAAATALGNAMQGSDIIALAGAFRTTADELLAVADQLADGDFRRADSNVS
jgi:excisionase family DNA binding protein